VSLAFEGAVLVAVVVYIPAFLLLPATPSFLLFWVLWLAQLALGLYAIVLAVRGWKGEDVESVNLPEALVRRLP
jgi:hypothetical protein